MRDIEPFLHRHFDVRHGRNDWIVDCPFCAQRTGRDDTKQHLQISMHKEAVHCFRCEYSNSWTGFVMDVTGKSYAFALGDLYVIPKPDLSQLEFSNISSNHANFVSEQRSHDYVRLPIREDNESFKVELRVLRRYLKARGFGPSYWLKYNLGYVPGHYRVYIPIEGDYWQARSVFPYQQPKYMSPEVGDITAIFNSKALQLYDEVVICEGAFSAMAVGDNAVALVGKNPVEEKVKRLKASGVKRFIIAVERNAEKQMLQLADRLSGRDVIIWQYAVDNDPADWVQPETISPYDFGTKLNMMLC